MQWQHSSSAARRYLLAAAVFPRLLIIIAAGALLGACAGLERTPPDGAAAIIISDRVTAYQQVADALRLRLADVPVYALEGDVRKAHGLLAKLRADDALPVITIGSLATRVAARLPERSIVFCQYFNPDIPGFLQATVRGVHATPPALKQLQAWKLLDPRLRRVALITGPNTGEFAREAQAAAARLDIQLEHTAVHSDRELLYLAKRIDAGVQGLWLVPDHQVLSVEILREALAYALRQGRQSLVFSATLLPYGGLLSVEGDPDDIAERVLEQLYARDPRTAHIAPLQRARARVNVEVARQLGLEVPAAMQDGLYVF